MGRRYRALGLSTIGVNTPRFPFGAEPAVVAAGLERLGVRFPVAIDAERELWHAYGCEGWPSLFLWNQGGALAWFHFGEGEYRGTEEAIQAELREIDALRELPEPMAPLRPTDAPGEVVIAPTPEVFPSGSWERPWVAGEDGETLELPYEAGGAYVTAEGSGEIAVEIDGAAGDPVAGRRGRPPHPRRAPDERAAHPRPAPLPWPAHLVGQLRRRRPLDRRGRVPGAGAEAERPVRQLRPDRLAHRVLVLVVELGAAPGPRARPRR